MAVNQSPIYTLTPKVSVATITTTYAQVKSDGTSAGSANDRMVLAFTAGSNGSFVDTVRFYCVANTAATSSVATTLRVYISSVAAPEAGATTQANTHLLAEISVPIVVASHSTNATNFYEIPIGKAIPSGQYIHVSQHVAQTTNQVWKAVTFGGDY
jgi:hypothetical protein